jgi:RND family efflux transporter MFP subunit
MHMMERDLSSLSIDPAVRGRRGLDKRVLIGGVLIVAAIIVVAVVLAFGRRAVEVAVVPAREGGTGGTTVLNASGYVTPQRRATVSAKITGKIKDVLIEEGMRVAAGQVLAHLDDVDAVAALRAAQADRAVAAAALDDLEVRLSNARRTLDRYRDLRKSESVSQEALDNAETSVESFEAQIVLANERVKASESAVDIARQNVDNCTIRAPFEGIIVSKDAQPGEMVSPISAGGGYTRTGIATVVDMTSLEVEVDVGESYIARVTPGQPVETVLDAYPDWRIPSKVKTVIPTADRQKATVKVRIRFDTLDPRILPDMGVKVSFLESGTDSSAAAAAVLVPGGAVIRSEGEQAYVLVVRDGRIERRAVRTGRERGAEIEVIAGLRPGEQVVSEPREGLREGARVSTRG